jgi:hypothetical protein
LPNCDFSSRTDFFGALFAVFATVNASEVWKMKPNYDKEIPLAQVSGKIVTRISSVQSCSESTRERGIQVNVP